MEAIERFTVGPNGEDDNGPIVVELHYDEDPMSPRESDNGTVMVGWGRESFGDKHYHMDQDDTWAHTLREYVEHYVLDGIDAVGWLPYYVIGGSQAAIYERDKDDDRAAGIIYMTREGQAAMGIPDDSVEDVLRGDLEAMDMYVRGDAYGYVVELPNGQVTDSCWGFYGEDGLREARAEALNAAVSAAEDFEDERNAAMEGTEQEVPT